MKKLALILPFAVFCCTNLSAQAKITNLSARLFYSENSESQGKNVAGSFSENIAGNPNFELWNTIIGGGAAQGNSDQTAVFVEISPVFPNSNFILNLTTQTSKKVISKQQKKFSFVSGKSKHYILFVLNETGCDKLFLKADLIEKNKIVSTLTKSLDFQCGE